MLTNQRPVLTVPCSFTLEVEVMTGEEPMEDVKEEGSEPRKYLICTFCPSDHLRAVTT